MYALDWACSNTAVVSAWDIPALRTVPARTAAASFRIPALSSVRVLLALVFALPDPNVKGDGDAMVVVVDLDRGYDIGSGSTLTAAVSDASLISVCLRSFIPEAAEWIWLLILPSSLRVRKTEDSE